MFGHIPDGGALRRGPIGCQPNRSGECLPIGRADLGGTERIGGSEPERIGGSEPERFSGGFGLRRGIRSAVRFRLVVRCSVGRRLGRADR